MPTRRATAAPSARARSWLSTSSLLLTLFVCQANLLTVVMAVDRSKFRTCQQTSFCRRHRDDRSKPAFDYRLLSDSIRFHGNQDDANADRDADRDADGGKEDGDGSNANANTNANDLLGKDDNITYYQKMKRFLSRSSTPGNDTIDPYVKGPPPFFTATLVNTSPDSYYSTGTSAGTGTGEEELDLAIHLHQDGVARLRITERYDAGHANADHEEEAPFAKNARWTSDELILNHEEMIGVDGKQVKVLDWNQVSDLVHKIHHHADAEEQQLDKDNFVAFQYGDLNHGGVDVGADADVNVNVNAALLLVQFQPFAIHMWRTGSAEMAQTEQPIVSFNSEQLFHFEVRRLKEQKQKHQHRENGNSDTEKEHGGDGDVDVDVDVDVKVDKHGGKEVVGYWEDGLAIYADGTREEKKETDGEHANTDTTAAATAAPTESSTFQIDTEGMWEEKFSSHHDSKPHGPTSVGADITFPASSHIFGLPEHASSTQLQSTKGEGAHYKEPYRLYNLDVFEYELDETMALYGEVPLIVSQSLEGGSVGVFWFNPSETFVDVEHVNDDQHKVAKTHWISESGIVDLFLLPGPNPKTLYEQYARLTGRVSLPPMFSLGYHQCRWNYRDEDDVYQVHGKFEELDYPYDVLWLDIEHTDGKRYFTWDDNQFPNPIPMQEKLSGQGRKMVTIVDPHIKRDDKYYIHKEATAKGLYIKDQTGEKDYDGWCWPGSSSYLDFTNEKVRSWWADQFAYNRYIGSTPSLYTWNDMNEPSVFNGPEISMQKDLMNLDGVEHREWHNLYGLLFQRATAEGLVRRNKGGNIRPFVLSRSFFAGSQRYGAIWTGDNESSWAHLQIAAPMLLSLNVGALSFVGADVGGFFGNPDAELMTRWMQAGAYQPFFRGHAHHDAKRREPWMFGDEWMVRMRRAAMARYALLPYWYNLFKEASVTGMPVMRTMWMEYPTLEELYRIDDQFLVGSDLLVKPVTHPGVIEIEILFPAADFWYDVDTMTKVATNKENEKITSITVSSDIDKIPVYQRGGSIIPRKLRLRRSTQMMINDPYTIYVALDNAQKASGEIYMDDEDTFDHDRKGFYAMAKLSVDISKSIRCEVKGNNEWINSQASSARMIERIVIMGLESSPKKISVDSVELEFHYENEKNMLVIRKPGLSALKDWEISLL